MGDGDQCIPAIYGCIGFDLVGFASHKFFDRLDRLRLGILGDSHRFAPYRGHGYYYYHHQYKDYGSSSS